MLIKIKLQVQQFKLQVQKLIEVHNFFDSNPRTKFTYAMDIAEAMVCFKRLGGKPLSAITEAMQSDYKQVAKIASELKIVNYKRTSCLC